MLRVGTMRQADENETVNGKMRSELLPAVMGKELPDNRGALRDVVGAVQDAGSASLLIGIRIDVWAWPEGRSDGA